MSYRKKLLEKDPTTLVDMIEELHLRVEQKNSELKQVRTKLNLTKSKVAKMKEMLQSQGKRILELYHAGSTSSK